MDESVQERIDELKRQLHLIRLQAAELDAYLDRLQARPTPTARPREGPSAVTGPPPAPAGAAETPPAVRTGPPEPAQPPPAVVIPEPPAETQPSPTGPAQPPPLPEAGVYPLAAEPGEGADRAVPPPAAPPVKPPPPAAPAKPKPRLSFEQRVGASWLNKVGIVVLILGALFFFQYAAQQGWISPTVRVLIGLAAGAALLVVGEWTLRRGMRTFAASVTGGGVALLYLSVYGASPKFFDLISTPWAFGLMCVVTAVGVVLSLRSGVSVTAIVAQIGAYLTPVVLSTGVDEQVVLMTYMILLAAGFSIVAAARGWNALAPIALAGTVLLFAGWYEQFYAPAAWARTMGFAWGLLAVFAAYAGVATALGRAHQHVGIAVAAGAGAGLALLLTWTADGVASWPVMAHLLALNAVVLALCLWRRWHWLRAGAVAWTMIVVSIARANAEGWTGDELFWSGWIWALSAVFLADVVIRAAWSDRRSNVGLDATLGAVVIGSMFASTYGLLDEDHHRWMGLYGAATAAATLGMAWLAHRFGRPRLAWSWLVSAMVLATATMPIQFDKAAVTVAWSIQAVVAMALARRLGHWVLLATAVGAIVLAALHFATVDVPTDERLAETLLTAGSVRVPWALALAAGLLAAATACAALTSPHRPAMIPGLRIALACGLLAVGLAPWLWQTAEQLPTVAATWWWLVPVAAIAVAGVGRRTAWLSLVGAALLGLAAGKFLLWDTLALRLREGPETGWLPALNWQSAGGVTLAAAWAAFGWAYRRRARGPGAKAVNVLAALVAGLLVVWAGSYEVDRYFASGRGGPLADVAQARQMALSIWWAAFAAGLLAIGFAARRPEARYMALGVFAVTLGKVLLVDMSRVDLVYRIASFLALGVLLLAASLLYQRFFRDVLAQWDKKR